MVPQPRDDHEPESRERAAIERAREEEVKSTRVAILFDKTSRRLYLLISLLLTAPMRASVSAMCG